MEFDTHIRLKDTGTLDLTTPASFEDVHQRLWDLFKTHCNQVGDGPHGECWLDYSKPLRTRHLIVDMEQDSEQPSSPIHLRFRGGSKPDYLCDILIVFLVLGAFWSLSKLFIIGFLAAAAAAAALYFWSGKSFGEEETAQLKDQIRKAFEAEAEPTEKE